MGLVYGLIVLIRPSNAIVIVIPLLYGVTDVKSLGSKIRLIVKNYKKGIIIFLFTLLMISPQILFWKMNTGNFFLWTYGNEKFYFTNPHIIEGIFSYRNGWLIYTPIMIFSLAGVFILKKYSSELFWPVIVFSCINIYIVFSWWCWWYSGFGNRAMVDSYAVWAIPMGAFYNQVFKSKIFSVFILLITLLLGYVNFYQTKQFTLLYVHYSCTSRASYWAAFMKKHPPADYWDLLKPPDHEAAVKGFDEPKGVDCFP